jgi:nitroreductase
MNIWHKILSTAIHPPSPHNVQPWRVKIVDDKCAELLIDSTRTLPKEDVTGSFIILTMRMFVEACRIFAANENLQLYYELFHAPEWYAPAILENKMPALLPFARLNLIAEETGKPIYDADLFFKRRRSRRAQVEVYLHDFETEMFAGRDIRIKNKYIG